MKRVAIVGAGIGAEHLRAYLALPERYEVAALCDLDTARATAVAQGRVPVVGDMGVVLADPTIDLIDVCLPPHVHLSASVAALESGKDVVCEKPMVASLAEAAQLREVMERTGQRVTPVFQYRYGLATARLAALIGAGLTGKAYAASIETHWNRDAAYYAVDWRGTWKGERGGCILGHAIHNHDLLCHVFGPVGSVQASVATRVNDIEVEDCAAIAFTMANGALASSSVTLGAANDTSRMRFVFEHLTVESGSLPYAPAEADWTFTARDPGRQAEVDTVVASVGPVRSGFEGFLEALADEDGTNPGRSVTFEAGARSLEIVTAIYASSRSGQSVSLPIGPEHPLFESWLPEGA